MSFIRNSITLVASLTVAFASLTESKAATVTFNHQNPIPTVASSGFSVGPVTAVLNVPLGPLTGVSLAAFAGTYPPGGLALPDLRLHVITEPGTGTGPTSVISDLVIYQASGLLLAHDAAGLFVALNDIVSPQLGSLGTLLTDLSVYINTYVPGFNLSVASSVVEEAAVNSFASVQGLSVSVLHNPSTPPSSTATPDGGTSLMLMGIGLLGCMGSKRLVKA